MPKQNQTTPKSQSEKFKAAAPATDCDEDEAAFEKRLQKIAKALPPKQEKPKPATPSRRRGR